jgi:PilZ domain-containing protein
MAEAKPAGPSVVAEGHSEKRRTKRVHISMPVRVRGKVGTQSFEEEALTASVSMHGCMVRLRQPVIRGQQLFLFNHAVDEELSCTVTYLGPKDRGKLEVGLEFIEASPRFWRINFPPDDWNPAERKRPGEKRP